MKPLPPLKTSNSSLRAPLADLDGSIDLAFFRRRLEHADFVGPRAIPEGLAVVLGPERLLELERGLWSMLGVAFADLEPPGR